MLGTTMAKFDAARFKNLLAELSKDPQVRVAMDRMSKSGGDRFNTQALRDFLPFIVRLSKLGGRRVVVLGQYFGLLLFLFELSLILKKNIFDRPEVKQFFKESWAGAKTKASAMYLMCSGYMKMVLKKQRSTKD